MPLKPVIFIGQAPSKSTDKKPPFIGRGGMFLAQILGISHEEMLSRFEFVNLLRRWPGYDLSGKGDAFPMAKARLMARRMLPSLLGRSVVLVGSNVEKAFALPHTVYPCHWGLYNPKDRVHFPIAFHTPGKTLEKAGYFAVSKIPHPSGINRWWNNPINKEMALDFLKTLEAQTRCPATTEN